MKRKIHASAFLFLVLFAIALSLPKLSFAQATTIQVGGVTRNMFVYAPSGLQQNRPLLISLHGLNQSADYQRNQAKWELVADTAKFVVVYPTAINLSWDISGDRDINFILAIIDAMVVQYKIDRSKVYVSGFSMGGMMSYHVANKIADKVAAIGPVSGYLFSNVVSSSRPMPLIHVHGTADDVVVYSGVAGVIEKWRTWNQCPSTGVTTRPYPSNKPSSMASLQYWGPCNNSAVALISLDGKGHWHSNDPAGVYTTTEIWNFIRKYSLPVPGPVINFASPANNASFSAGTPINLSVNASSSNGTINNVKFYSGTTLLSTDNSAPYSFTWLNAPVGLYQIKAVATDNQGKTAEATVSVKINVAQGAYNGTVQVIPGTIQAEAFDAGGNGFAYFDNTSGSSVTPVVNFRTDEDVDIENCTDAGGGYNVGWATAGEWLEYTVNVHTTGIYTMDLRVACQGDGRTMSVSMDGANIASNVAIPNTTGWQTWQTMSVNNISLTAGQKIMRITIGATDYINLNSVTFTLYVPPVATITASGATTFCDGESVVLNASTGTNYSYQWKKDGNVITNATASSYTATQSGSYTVTVNANSQTATSTAVNIVANPLPNAPVVTSPVMYCQNATATQLTATGSNLKWYTVSSGGASSATAPTLSTATVGNANYYVSQTTNGCEGSRATIVVNVNALPVITSYVQVNGGAWAQQSAVQLCAGGSVVLGPQPISATGWSWTGPNGFISSSREVSLASISPLQGGIYTASYTANGCSSSQLFNVKVNSMPNAPIVAAVSYCQNTTAVKLTATGSNLKWYTVPSGGTSSVIAPTPSTATAGVTNYYVSQTTNSCESLRATIAVTINETPNEPVVMSSVSYCQNAIATQLTATGSNLKWYSISSGGTSSVLSPTPSTATVGVTNYYVSQSSNGCESSRAMIAVTINSLPDAVITPSGSTTIIEGGSVTLNANTSSGLSYKWFNGTTQVGAGSSYVATSTGSYMVEISNEFGCKKTSLASNVIKSQNQAPIITIVSPSSNSNVNGPITITVEVSDPDGGIALVEYLDGTTVIGTSTSLPYSFIWDNPSVGEHEIMVRVTDSNGGITTSFPVLITSEVTTTGMYVSSEIQGVVYPNPASREMIIKAEVDLSNAKVSVINVLGEEIQLQSMVDGKEANIDVSSLPEGTYILIIRKEKVVLRKKIVIN